MKIGSGSTRTCDLQTAVGHERGLPRAGDYFDAIDGGRMGVPIAEQIRRRGKDLERSDQIQDFRPGCGNEHDAPRARQP